MVKATIDPQNKGSIDSAIKAAVDSFSKFSRAAESELDRALTTSALMVEADAKKNQTPHVDTGRLRGSITHRLGGTKDKPFAEVGTNVEYGIYQEFGTSKMKANPFLTPALESNRNKIKAIIAQAIKAAESNAGR